MEPCALRATAAGAPFCRLGEVAAAGGGHLLAGPPDLVLRGVAADTRAVRPGDLFCAVRGERVDAHTLIPAALAAGAAAVLVDRMSGDGWHLGQLPPGRGAVWVPAVLPALGRLARAHLDRLRAAGAGPRVAAVTGSVGKTGTRALMAAALRATGRPVLEAEESFNTELTVPLVCLRASAEHRFAALELAMRGPGQIAHLARVCRPEVGVLTVIGESHLEVLGSVEAIAAAKGELLEALPPDGCAVLNADDPRQAALRARARCRVVTYGLGPGADVAGEGLQADAAGCRLRVHWPGGRHPVAVSLSLLGEHQARNALAALACAWAMGVDPAAAAEALHTARPLPGRLRLRQCGALRVLDDAYNAAPQSMRAALAALALVAPPERRAAVLGDMLELGPASAEGHAAVGRCAAGLRLRWLLTVGPLAAGIASAAVEAGLPRASVVSVLDRVEAAAALPALLSPGLTVLVKGSRAVGLEETVAAIAAWGRAHGRR